MTSAAKDEKKSKSKPHLVTSYLINNLVSKTFNGFDLGLEPIVVFKSILFAFKYNAGANMQQDAMKKFAP